MITRVRATCAALVAAVKTLCGSAAERPNIPRRRRRRRRHRNAPARARTVENRLFGAKLRACNAADAVRDNHRPGPVDNVCRTHAPEWGTYNFT